MKLAIPHLNSCAACSFWNLRILTLDSRADYLTFAMRWQQFSGPVMAKGVEDTAGYVHNSLISLNEVGSDSEREKPPMDVNEFHRFLRKRLRHWPHSMNATSTHDTKRSEDVRARINVLSELPGEWEKRLSAGAASTGATELWSTKSMFPPLPKSPCSIRRCSARGLSIRTKSRHCPIVCSSSSFKAIA